MKRKLDVSRVSFSMIAHATEDKELLERIFRGILPEKLRGKARVEESSTKGYHGDEIRVYRTTLSGKDALEALEKIISSLTEESMRFLSATIERRLQNDRILHLRLGKQELVSGKYVLVDTDETVKITVRFDRKASPHEIEERFLEVRGENPRGHSVNHGDGR